jgi:formylglycine-generating enzyme required for sulfatase activity
MMLGGPLAWGEGKNVALVVGVREYQHSKLENLDYPSQDALELAKVLKGAGFTKVVVMHSEQSDASMRPNYAQLTREIDGILDGIGKEDVLLIALSGHGVENSQKENFFCAMDANPFTFKQCVPLRDLLKKMHESGVGSGLLLVDACRDEAKLPRGAKGASGDSIIQVPEGVAALFSCASNQQAFESKEAGGGHGIFFHAVIEGLTGRAADVEGDVTWDGLVSHVKKNVPNRVKEWVGPSFRQTPHSVGSQVGAVMLAKYSPLRAEAPRREEMRRPSSETSSNSKSITSKTTGAKLLLIPAGEFLMGSPDTELSWDGKHESNESPQHQVRITKPFYLGETEVTQKQWRVVMGTEPWKGQDYVKEGDDYAATYVNWADAVEYCKRLSAKDGRTYRLPTEAEWEYSCRAGTQTKWSFGDSADELSEYAWYDANAWNLDEKYAHRVGQKKSNGWGLRDMHGNVWEWCSDWYGEDYYKRSPGEDPSGPSEGSDRVYRGGGWHDFPVNSRSAIRLGDSPDSRFRSLGFRLASSSVE